jgi:sporulation protein YlmC with PRC-barrel domain
MMMWRFSSLVGNIIEAQDGAIGKVKDLLFDDDTWRVKWLVVDTGNWLPGRQVLVPVATVGKPHAHNSSINVDLSMNKIENSPGLGFDQPVSRQAEATMFGYYGLDPFLGAGLYPVSNAMAVPFDAPLAPPSDRQHIPNTDDPHLRSMAAVKGYHCHATDGDLGFVADLLIDPKEWRVTSFVVDTGIWWPGNSVLISPASVAEIIWIDSHIDLKLDRAAIKAARPFKEEMAGIDSVNVGAMS